MSSRLPKFARRALVIFSGLVLLAVSVLSLGWFLVNSGPVQERARGFLQHTFDDRLVVDRFHIALLPRPRLVLQQVAYLEPPQLQVRAAKVVFVPQLRALLRGRVQIHATTIDTPEIVLVLSEKALPVPGGGPVNHQAQNQFKTFLGAWPRFFEGGRLSFNTAAVTLVQGGKRRTRFDLTEGRLTGVTDHLEVHAHGRSDLAADLAFYARLGSAEPTVAGKLSLKGLHAGAVADLVAGRNIGFAADLDLALDFASADLTAWNLSLYGNQSTLALTAGERQVTLHEPNLAVQLELTPGRMAAHLNHLRLEKPRVDLGGTLIQSHDGDPRLQLDLQGDVVDLTALHAIAQGLTEGTPTLMQIVRGGTLSQIRLSASSPTWTGLAAPDAFSIEGLVADGRLTIPHVDMALTEVAGWIGYENATLSGRQASARFGASAGHNGQLVLRTDAHPVELALTLDLEADLSQLPPILEKAVANPNFSAEMGLVQAVNGRAAGRLLLDGPVDRLAVEVRVDSVAAQIEYARLPYPLELSGGRIAWRENTFAVDELAGALANSRFSGLTGKVVWGEVALIDVQQAFLNLACDELNDWFKPQAAAWWPGAQLEIPAGRIAVTGLSLYGPAAFPRQWTFEANGTVADLMVSSSQTPAAPTLHTGRFTAAPGRLTVEDARVSMLDGLLNGAVTVSLGVEREPLLVFGPVSGSLGRRVMSWVYRQVNLPERYRIDVPLKFELDKARWERRQGWTLAAQLAWLDQQLKCAGRIVPQNDGLFLDLEISALRIDVAALEQVLASVGEASAEESTPFKTAAGRVAVRVDRLEYRQHVLEPFAADFTFSGDGVFAEIVRADRCGISITGRADWSSQGIDLKLQPRARNQRLQYIGGCITGVRSTERFEGRLSLEGGLHARGRTMGELAAATQGTVFFRVANGRVTNIGGVGTLTNLLSFLKINRLLSGTAPDFSEKDFPFEYLAGYLDFSGPIVTIREALLQADALNLAAEGTVDIDSGEVNLMVLVSPLNTVDTLVRKIPVLGDILQGTLVAVPVGVSGQLTNPTIVPLSPRAVGTRVWEILTRTLKTPLRLIQPLLPSNSE